MSSPSAAPPAARISPGGLRDLGVPIWLFSRVAGRVTGTGPPRVFTTLGRHHRLFWGWLHFAGALMPGGRLPRTETELLILRVAHVRGSAYEQGHHERLARRVGVPEGDVARVADGSSATGWTPRQALLLRATESLLETRDLPDDLWSELGAELDERECLELLLLVGHYDMLATTLTTLRVQPEERR